jgi:hypothetical protein
VPGKDILGDLAQWSQLSFSVNFSPGDIATELRQDEIAPEVRMVLSALVQRDKFQT